MSMRQLYNRCKDKKNEDNYQTKCELFLKNIKILSIIFKHRNDIKVEQLNNKIKKLAVFEDSL